MAIRRRRSVSVFLVLALTLVVVQAVVAIFSVDARRRGILDRYASEAALVVATLDPDRLSDATYRNTLISRLSGKSVIGIEPTPSASAASVSIDTADQTLAVISNGVTVTMDTSDAGAELSRFAEVATGVAIADVTVSVILECMFLTMIQLRPLRLIEESLRDASSRRPDLTRRLREEGGADARGIAKEFNSFIARIATELSSARDPLDRLSESLAGATGDLTSLGDAVSHAGERVRRNGEQFAVVRTEIAQSDSAVESLRTSATRLIELMDSQVDGVSDALSAVEQMNATIKSLGDTATDRKTNAAELLVTARSGAERMHASVTAIAEIESSTNEILGMIDVINGIARQTNLLSMNAAIEAAHAGVAGKGFAVVAEEIQNLAEQSANNAKSIDRTLRSEVKKIGEAGHSNRDAAGMFDSVLAWIGSVVGAMEELVSALNEESAASRQILTAVEDINRVASDVRTVAGELAESIEKVRSAAEHTGSGAAAAESDHEDARRMIDGLRTTVDAAAERLKRAEQAAAALGARLTELAP